MTEPKNYYAILGLPRNADGKGIRDAYRKLARQYHPDLHPENGGAEARLKEINEAYDTLSDPDKRRKYNLLGSDWEGILRDEADYRAAAGFGAAATSGYESRARPDERTAFSFHERFGARETSQMATPLLGIPRQGWIAAVGLLMLASGLLVWSRRSALQQEEVEHQRIVQQVWAATGNVRDLYGAVAGSGVRILHEGVEIWTKLCLRRLANEEWWEQTGPRNYEKRFPGDAERVIEQINTAERASLFTLPLIAADCGVVNRLLSLRADFKSELGRLHVLDCTRLDFVDHFTAMEATANAGALCLDRISRLGAEGTWREIKAGHSVCGPVHG